jgi:hypothetical protein
MPNNESLKQQMSVEICTSIRNIGRKYTQEHPEMLVRDFVESVATGIYAALTAGAKLDVSCGITSEILKVLAACHEIMHEEVENRQNKARFN